ncbi:carotenoid isomerooxygenase-like [Pararge aegeria]|uniref:carotenoid isomerooxygenase-like n=1 Tax=Pararge aegeria TaxID=116150 RepID=UPI0019CF5F56|nr:carotenoid isomerooxygenase-like [Pararge aegeria]
MSKTEKLNPEYDMQPWLRSCEVEIKKPIGGETTGTIPQWLQGTLIRNGPGSIKCGSEEFVHVFDGPALIHRFALKNGQATYQCRFLKTDTLRKNNKAQRIVVSEFGTKSVPDPCHTIFDRLASVFNPYESITDNAGVSVYPFGDEVYAMTEVTNVYKIDPETLESLEKENLFNALIVCHTAHPHIMPNGDVYNVGLNIVRGMMKHVIVKFPYVEKGDMFKMAEVIHTITPRWLLNPSYMHSFGMTENYFVIMEQPLSISLFTILKNHVLKNPFSNSLNWYPEHETQIRLVNRNTGEETSYRTETFFFMHTINTFEKDNKLIIDVVTYKDAKIIDAMYVEAIKDLHNNPDYGQWSQSRPKRITIPLDAPPNTKVEMELIADVGIEATRIHYDVHNALPYKYFYGIGSEVHSKYAGSIIKINANTGEVKTWHEYHGCPSEPIFVPHPDAKDEDDGVLLSALLWGNDDHAMTLLVLDAKDLKELARANFKTPSPAPNGFHGWYWPDQTI